MAGSQCCQVTAVKVDCEVAAAVASPRTSTSLAAAQAEMLVTVFNSSMMEFVTPFSHPLYKLVDGGNGTRIVATTRHTWSDSPDGLQLRTQMLLGLMARGSRDSFETNFLAKKANPKIQEAYLVSRQWLVRMGVFGSVDYGDGQQTGCGCAVDAACRKGLLVVVRQPFTLVHYPVQGSTVC
jgi:hypothetical protein